MPIKGAKRDMLHVIDDDLAVQYLPAKKIKRHRLALACKPNNVFFWCIVPSQNLDNAWNADALKACHLAQTRWVQATSRRPEGVDGYKIDFAQDQDAFVGYGLADAFEGRIAGGHVQGSQYRPRPAPRSVAPDRGQAGPDLMSRHARRYLQKYFRRFVVLDFEYEVADGGLPNVLCLVAYILDENLRHVETIRRWRGEFGTSPPFPIDDDTLIVGYSLWAEMTCFMQLGWRFPKHVYDLHTAYLSISNILLPYNPDETRIKQRKGLSYACCAYGIEGWERIDKPEMARAIGEGRWREYGQPAVFDYCEEDVRNSAELLRRQLSGYCNFAPIDPQLVMAWSEYSAKSVARIQAAGMPIDMPLWNLGAGKQGRGDRRADRAVRSQPGQRVSDLFSRGRILELAVRAVADCCRHCVLAATGFRRAPTRRRCVPDDVSRAPGNRRAARIARCARRHRPRPDPDRA